MSYTSGGRSRSLDTRREIVDILEHCYGPLFLSIGFGIFLTLDPAREVMVVFASEIVALVLRFGTYWPGVLILAAMIVLVFAAGKRSADTQAAAPRRHANTGLAVRGGLLAAVIVGFVTIVFAFIPVAWQDVITLPARIFLGVFAFFYVPVLLWWATGYALKAEQGDIDSHDFDPETIGSPIASWILTMCGRIPLILAGYALFTEGLEGTVEWFADRPIDLPLEIWGQEAEGTTALTLVVLSAIVLLVAVLRWLAKDANEAWVGGSIRTAPFGAAFVGIFVLLSFVFPHQTMTIMAGPIAISSMFVIVASILLAALTYLSKLPRKGDFPLVLILVAFTIASAGAGGALGMVLASLLMLFIFAWRQEDQSGWRRAGAALTLCFAVLWIGQLLSPLCKTAAGCNIIQGVALPEGAIPPEQESAVAAYESWKAARPELETVTLVAAQGGGLFAAYHAAYDLAYRQDVSVEAGGEATFADGLFAVSGVSGGSFGAAAFWAIRESGFCERWAQDRTLMEIPEGFAGCYTYLTHRMLDRDYLSLSLSGLLFADMIDGMFPYSALFAEPVDRAHRFTEQYIEAVDQVLRSNGAEGIDRILATGLRQSWSASGGTPLLFLNTTDLYTGDRVVQSPLTAFLPPAQVEDDEQAPPATDPARVRILDNSGTERDLSVANAAVLSARFPIVSPPGRYRECGDASCEGGPLKQIADGGYFDNTGLETIADILTAIEPALGDTEVEVISYSISERTEEEREAARVTKGTLTAPISGVIAATTARRALTVDRFCERWIKNGGTREAISARLDLTTEATHNFTLSWLLSADSFGQIADKVQLYHGAEQGLCR